MSNQTKMEIIKALAYGERLEQVAEAEGVDVFAVKQVQCNNAVDIAEEQTDLQKAGYIV